MSPYANQSHPPPLSVSPEPTDAQNGLDGDDADDDDDCLLPEFDLGDFGLDVDEAQPAPGDFWFGDPDD